MKIVATSAILAAVLVVLSPSYASARPMSAEDLYHLNLLDQAQISPDGTHVIVVEKRMNGPKNRYDSTILLVDLASGTTVNATHGTRDGDAALSPDSKSFYFVRHAKKVAQIFRFDLATRDIVQITHAKSDVSGPTPSNDGKRLAFTIVDVDPAPATRVDFAKAGFKPSKSEQKSDIRTIDQLFWTLNGAGLVYDKHPHIWVSNADGSGTKQITSGRFGEGNEYWSSDDRTLVFNSLRYDSVDGGNDIYSVPATGGNLQKLASDQPVNNIYFVSRRAQRLIYGASGTTDPAEYPAMRWADFDGSNVNEFVKKNTLSFGDALLADMKEGGGPCGGLLPGERHAVINADGPGYANLRLLDLASGAVSDLSPPKGEAWSCTVSRDGKRVAYLYSDFMHPGDVYVLDVASPKPRALTHVNDALLRTIDLSMPLPFTVKDSAGYTVQAWFMPAVGKRIGPRPTILDIHGGPETQFGDTFFQEFQFLAGLGYNVVFSDPRGSVGFGYAFESALTKSYGDAMFDDVQAVMDAAVKRPDVDVTRLGASGGSYGGYATLWVISHTDRYKTAIAERAVNNLVTENLGADFASKTGLGGFANWGNPWDPQSLWFTQSPINFVQNVHTPLLILHSENDTRAPSDQTITEFSALKILGQKVTFIDVPDEDHDLSRTGAPIHRVERLNILANWLNAYLHPLH
jgi:dipeptidyl aminopeptidase/acylaminoacyl peptidase